MSFLPTMKPAARGATCIVGLGAEFGDDRLGWWVADRLRDVVGGQRTANVQFACACSATDLLGLMGDIHELILIDACQGLGEVGEVLRLTWPTLRIANLRQPFGHNIGLDEVFHLAAKLGQLPAVCEIWCVEGREFGFGSSLSPEVETAGHRIANEIAGRLHAVNCYA